jgi:putative transposase
VAVGLKDLLQEKANQLDVDSEALEIKPDHVHPFLSSDPTKAPQQRSNQFKEDTSRVMRQEFAHLGTRRSVLWSRAYFVGSVGHVCEETVRKTIETQEQGS